MLPALLGMLALSAVKSQRDQERADRDRAMKAEMMRYSPWTGMGRDPVFQNPDAMATLMQGGMTGAMMGSMMDQNAPAAPNAPAQNENAWSFMGPARGPGGGR